MAKKVSKKRSQSKERAAVPASQTAFAKMVGISQPAVSQLVARKILTTGATLDTWLLQYTENLRLQASQHKTGKIDRVKEAALLDRMKREEIEVRLAEKLHELIPVEIFIEGVSQTFTAVRAGIFAIPNKFKSQCPHVPLEDLEILRQLIRDLCTEFSSDRFPAEIRARLEESLGRNGAAAEPDGKPVGGREAQAQQ